MRARRSKQWVMKSLREMGIHSALAARAYLKMGYDAVDGVKNDPYCLFLIQEQLKWREVDDLARSLGVEREAPERIAGAVRHLLRQAVSEGHVYLPRGELLSRLPRCLGFDGGDDFVAALGSLADRGELVFAPDMDGEPVYLRAMHRAESAIARLLTRLYNASSSMALAAPSEGELRQVEDDLGIQLAPAQRDALRASLESKLAIITGGPGTGKTTIVKGVLNLWEKRRARIRLAAPTGRAAKRLAESTGRRAATLHRTLEYNPETGGFRRGAGRTLPCDLMVVDEASMVDTELMASLLEALKPSTHLLFVGDVDQLPSVGPGYVLHDLISSGFFRSIALDEIHRQSRGSLISLNARKINMGEMPEIRGEGVEAGQDFFFIARQSADDAKSAILEMVLDRIPRQFGLDPKSEVQVLSPMIKRGPGVEALNGMLQERLNPAGERHSAPFYRFSEGDKVMQTKNDYERDVFNGDIGFVTRVDASARMAEIEFEGRLLDYEFQDLANTSLAYAMTVHKSQGGEYPAVAMPVVTEHYPMLQRNLLYTAVSRGKRLVVLAGQPNALEIAVRNNKIGKRHTGLGEMLRRAFLRETADAESPPRRDGTSKRGVAE